MTETDQSGQLDESILCRLCAQINPNGSDIFSEEVEQNLSVLINKYLPLKVENDGKYPCKICPGCEIQLEATKLFFDLIIEGQNQLKSIYVGLKPTETIQLGDLQNISSKTGTLELHSVETGEKYFIQIMGDTPSDDGPLYSTDHEILKDMNILNKEKKKRGRPRKQQLEKYVKEDIIEPKKSEENSETVDDGKRQRKVPARFSETVQGKELDDILRKEGIEVEDLGLGEPVKVNTEVIGIVENQNGEKLEETVVVTKVLNGNRFRRSAIPRRKKRRKFRCDYCSEEFKYYPKLKMHMQKEHNEQTINETDEVLNSEFSQEKNDNENPQDSLDASSTTINGASETLNGELETATVGEEKQADGFSCALCNEVCDSVANLNEHLKSNHQNGKLFKCPECKRSFSYVKTFEMHLRRHRKGIYVCEVCQKKFNHASSLIYHRNAEHNGKRFVCSKCNKTFKHRQLLQRHQLVHTEERPYKCTLCSSAFKTKTNLISHNSVHTGEKNYVCSECGQSFAHKTSLNMHMRWHLGEKPHSCEICKKAFSQKGNLMEHMRIHTGEKPFCCEICGSNFTTSSQLKLHTKRHTGERPWKCEYCPKSFLHKDTWKEHCRRHLNDKPYKCELCNKAFTAMYCLKKHMRFHTGEKPHTCDICLKAFSDFSNLAKHKKTHDTIANDNQNVSVFNTETDNLLYVYYETPKDDGIQVPLVDLGQVESEGVIGNDQGLNFKDNCMQIQQLIDQEGNPLSLNTQDGQQINVVTSITDGEEKLQGLLPDGTLVTLDLQESKVDSMKRLVDHVEEETSVSHLLLDGNMTFLSDNIDKTGGDLLVPDQSNICFVTYDPDTQSIQ